MIVNLSDARAFCGAPDNDSVLKMLLPGVHKAVAQFLGWNPGIRDTFTRTFPKGEPGGADDYFVGTYGVIPRAGGATDVLSLDHKYVLLSGLQVWECAGAYFGQSSETAWTALTLGTHYALEVDEEDKASDGGHVSRSGHLLRMGTEWPKSRGSVKVTYTAGFTATELDGTLTGSADWTDASDLRLAILQAIGAKYSQTKMHQYQQQTGRPGGLATSESIEGYSYTLDGQTAQMTMGLAQPLPLESMQLLQKYRAYGKLLRSPHNRVASRSRRSKPRAPLPSERDERGR